MSAVLTSSGGSDSSLSLSLEKELRRKERDLGESLEALFVDGHNIPQISRVREKLEEILRVRFGENFRIREVGSVKERNPDAPSKLDIHQTTSGFDIDIGVLGLGHSIPFHIDGILNKQERTRLRKRIYKNKRRLLQLLEVNERIYKDSLTTLYNRNLLNQLKTKLDVENKNYLIFYFDAVGLRKINNTYGHWTGSMLLITFSALLNKVFGTARNVHIIRHGGDEFIAMIETDDSDDTETLQEKVLGYMNLLQQKIRRESRALPSGVQLDAKVGVAIHEKNTSHKATDMIQIADPKGKRYVQTLQQALPIDPFNPKNLRIRKWIAEVRRFVER